MSKYDENNLLLVETADSVDKINASFYGRFPYPWAATKFDRLSDPGFYADMLNQELGDWGHNLLRPDARIWVAGCGVNQAIFTALRFPQATVLGSDVSATSLEICDANARALGVTNLELRRESLNHVAYSEQFDYVICTGVIHHNADPRSTLERLSAALKPSGVMELMVYNRFHWVIPVAFQKAVRMLCSSRGESPDFEKELSITRRLIDDAPPSLLLKTFLKRYNGDSPESMLADELLQPVLHSYTVDSLQDMAASCNLELLLPCLNQLDKVAGAFSWNLTFNDPVVRELYESLPDTRRWQITNLLLLDNSPMLWFYLQRADAGRPRKPEPQVCEEFLDTVFTPARARQSNFICDEHGGYKRSPNEVSYPVTPPEALVRPIFNAVDGRSTIREIFARLRLETTFGDVNRARLKLTTPAFPYLKAIRHGALVGTDDVNLSEVDTRRLAADKFEKFKGVKPKSIQLPRQD
jgi:SAM-dependent methyltransferase